MMALLLGLLLAIQAATARTALAVVLGPQNQRIVDVGPDDFVVREANEPREVLDTRIADYPVAVLVDDCVTDPREFDAIRRAAARFIARIGQRPIALGTLTRPDALVASFDDGRDQAAGRLPGLAPRPDAPRRVLQAVALAARAIRDTGAPFSAIVVVSAAPAAVTQGSGDELTSIVASGAAVHVIASRPPGPAQGGDLVRELSDQTHGHFTTIYSMASYGAALDHLADELSTEILIEYLAGLGTNVPAASEVTLGIRIPGTRVVGMGVR